MKLIAALALVAVLATSTQSPAAFLRAHQGADGGFAEDAGRTPSPALTAWASLGLVAAGERPEGALDYLREHARDVTSPPTRALVALAMAALGDPQPAAALPIAGAQTNTIVWTILARRQARLSVPRPLVAMLLDRQARTGGWGWGRGVAPDSNDTAAAVQALRAARISGAPIRRALAYLETTRGADGGFGLLRGRGSDAQSTAWAIQAYLAAGSKAPPGSRAYLRGLRQEDGSYRYSKQYAVTPVWVTAQVLPALAGRPFPLP